MRDDYIKVTLNNSSSQYKNLMEIYDHGIKHKLRIANIELGIYEVMFFETLSYRVAGVQEVETTFTLARLKRVDK